MKTLSIFFLFFIISHQNLTAQVYVQGKDINQIEGVEYIELMVDSQSFVKSVFAEIDFGQTMYSIDSRRNRIEDSEGKDIRFKSEIDIFNFLYKNGWEHRTTYPTGEAGCARHIFQRKPKPTSEKSEK
jgi:hypothetical protein